jgi:hypothetical protein
MKRTYLGVWIEENIYLRGAWTEENFYLPGSRDGRE